MENITISSKIDSTFEFEMTAQGIEIKDSKTLFQTEVSPGIKYDVECQNVDGRKWSVTIPKGLIPNGSYDFNLCVIAEEFYFQPVTGKLNVVSAETIKVSGVTVELDPEEEKKEEKKTVQEQAQQPVESDISPDTSDVQSTIQKIKEQLANREAPERRFEFFKTNAEVEEDRLANRKFRTIFPEGELPENTKVSKPIVEVQEKVEIDEAIKHEIEDVAEPVVENHVEAPKLPAMFSKSPIIAETAPIDPNDRVKNILSSMKEPTPIATIEVTETQPPGKFFEEVDGMREINRRRKTNKAVKDAIRNTTNKDKKGK